MESIKNSYLCNYCGEKDYTKFPKDRKTTCKKCRYAMKKKTDEVVRIVTEPKKNFRDQFNNFLMNDNFLFDGMTTFQTITELNEKSEENEFFKEETSKNISKCLNEYKILTSDIQDYLREVMKISEENVELKNRVSKNEQRNLELINENLELRKMTNILSERISNLENK